MQKIINQPENRKPSCKEDSLSLEKAAAGERELQAGGDQDVSNKYGKSSPEICADVEKLESVELQCDQGKNEVQGDRSDCDENECLEGKNCTGIQNNVNEIDNQEWNKQCEQETVKESVEKLQCDQDQREIVQCVEVENAYEVDCQVEIKVKFEKEVQREQNEGGCKENEKEKVQSDQLEMTRCDENKTLLQCDQKMVAENIKGLKCDENEAGEAGEVVKKNIHLPDPDLRIEGI